MRTRQFLLILALIVTVVAAVFALVQQQRAANDARVAVTSQFVAESRRATAVSDARSASTAQALAEFLQSTAVAIAQVAVTGQAQARSDQSTAVADANLAATGQSLAESGQGTAVADANQAATGQALAEDERNTAVADANLAVTGQALAESGQGTAVADANLALTAQSVAESDLLTAVARADLALTAQFIAESGQGTAVANAYLTATQQSAQLTATADSRPTTEPSPTLTVQPGTLTSQHFVSQDGTIEFDYPGGWVVTEVETGFIIIGDSQESLAALAPGGIVGFVFTVPATADSPDSELTRVALVVGQALASRVSSNPLDFSSQRQTTIGGHRASRVEGANADIQMSVYVIDPGSDSYLIVIGMTTPDGLPAFEGEMTLIGGSLEYTPG